MKQKKIGKKLILNKRTIVGLDDRQINAAYGGIDPNGTGISDCYCCATGDPASCTYPETQDPTATFVPRICACCR